MTRRYSSSYGAAAAAWLLVLTVLLASGCERETRRYQDSPASNPADTTRITDFEPGGKASQAQALSPYQENAYGLAEGKRLYSAYNCNGCHAQGGGGIGPALMDEKWIYGSEPQRIYSTISQGRPNGMPAFGAKVPSQQIWQLVGYVQSLSAHVPRDAAPSRNDDLNGIKPELRLDRLPPRHTGHR
jgi:cytochrome c oxidase cbb3-type subunit III